MLIKSDPSQIEAFLHDSSNMPGGHADRVFIAQNEDEIASLLSDSSRNGTPVTVAGAGTGIVGGRLPFGGIVLATERLNQFKIEPSAGIGVGGAGVLLSDYVSAVAERGLLYPPDPTEGSCFLGGTVATNASGARTFKYGATRKHIRRLKIVLATGQILDISRGNFFAEIDGAFSLPLDGGNSIDGQLPGYQMPAVRKNASGYFVAPGMDLIDLFIGSEGTLGVITEVETNLIPIPESVLSGVVFFELQGELLKFVEEVRRLSFESRRSLETGSIDARAVEYFDAESLDFMRSKNEGIPEDAAGAIFFEQEIHVEMENEILSAWMELLERSNAMTDGSWFATSETDRKRLREFRHALPVGVNEWLSHHGQQKISTDMAVPDEAFSAMLDFYQKQLIDACLKHVIFGHIGDSHVHVNILPYDDRESDLGRQIYSEFIERAIAVGGTVSAEHGIGKLKRKYLKMLYGDQALKEMAELKKVFDPAGILGRGNIFSEDYL